MIEGWRVYRREFERIIWTPFEGRWTQGTQFPDGFDLQVGTGSQLPGPYQVVRFPNRAGLILEGGVVIGGRLTAREYRLATGNLRDRPTWSAFGPFAVECPDEMKGYLAHWWRGIGSPSEQVRVIGFRDLRLPQEGELLLAPLPGGWFEVWRMGDRLRGRVRSSGSKLVGPAKTCYLDGSQLGDLLEGWAGWVDWEASHPYAVNFVDRPDGRIPERRPSVLVGIGVCWEHRMWVNQMRACFEVVSGWAKGLGR